MNRPVLLAWIERRPDKPGCIAAFVAERTTREPARRYFITEKGARAWIEAEAAALGAPVVWKAPGSAEEGTEPW